MYRTRSEQPNHIHARRLSALHGELPGQNERVAKAECGTTPTLPVYGSVKSTKVPPANTDQPARAKYLRLKTNYGGNLNDVARCCELFGAYENEPTDYDEMAKYGTAAARERMEVHLDAVDKLNGWPESEGRADRLVTPYFRRRHKTLMEIYAVALAEKADLE